MKKVLLFPAVCVLSLITFSCSNDFEEMPEMEVAQEEFTSEINSRTYAYPYDKINGYWKLQTHLSNGSGGIQTISYEPLKTYSHNIYKMVDGHVQFTCPATGATTSGSSNPRTELRQLKSDGKDIKWSSNTGTRKLRVKFKVMEMTSSGSVAVAQLFSANNGGDQVKIQVRKQSDGTYDLQFSGDAVGSTFKAIDNMELNKWIDLTITVSSDNASINYEYNNSGTTFYKSYSLSYGSDYYFKAGTYVLSGVSGQAVVRFTTLKATYTN